MPKLNPVAASEDSNVFKPLANIIARLKALLNNLDKKEDRLLTAIRSEGEASLREIAKFCIYKLAIGLVSFSLIIASLVGSLLTGLHQCYLYLRNKFINQDISHDSDLATEEPLESEKISESSERSWENEFHAVLDQSETFSRDLKLALQDELGECPSDLDLSTESSQGVVDETLPLLNDRPINFQLEDNDEDKPTSPVILDTRPNDFQLEEETHNSQPFSLTNTHCFFYENKSTDTNVSTSGFQLDIH